jgi:hypothetical protein
MSMLVQVHWHLLETNCIISANFVEKRVQVHDACRKEELDLSAMLFCTMHDYPSFRYTFGEIPKGSKALGDTIPRWVSPSAESRPPMVPWTISPKAHLLNFDDVGVRVGAGPGFNDTWLGDHMWGSTGEGRLGDLSTQHVMGLGLGDTTPSSYFLVSP